MPDPSRPYAFLNEREPVRDELGCLEIASVSTIFLTARRCPINCTMCDLHRFTNDGPTEKGMIPRQVRLAQAELDGSDWIKLYNSGNFFDSQSIPTVDYESIAELCRGYDRVIVENHPRIGRALHERFRSLLSCPLEVAVGLETVQPRWMARIGKQLSRDQFDAYCCELSEMDIDIRVFLIAGVPGISVDESKRWTRLSVRHAVARGARHISMIPARPGQGWAGQADQLPRWSLHELSELYSECLEDLRGAATLSVDLWDLESVLVGPLNAISVERFATAVLQQEPFVA